MQIIIFYAIQYIKHPKDSLIKTLIWNNRKVLEFWAKSTKDDTTIKLHKNLLLAIPKYWKHFKVSNNSDCSHLDIPYSSDIEYSSIYYYDRDTVLEEGVTYIYPNKNASSTDEYNKSNNYLMHINSDRPKLHFSPFSGWMNDPNGLIKIDDTYHMFYQYYPNATHTGPIHWGHATSKNLMDWVHLPVFLYPDEGFEKNHKFGGMFSGCSLPLNSQTEKFRVFLTHRDESGKGSTSFKEYQVEVFPNKNLIEADRINTIIENKPHSLVGNDFRDPKVFLDSDGVYKMIIGSTYKQKPAILLYTSKDLDSWEYHSVLYVAAGIDADSAECPNLFKVKDKYILIVSYTGYTHKPTGRRNLLYAMVGDFKDNIFTPEYSKEVDFGTDFYALQGFFDTSKGNNKGTRLIAFGWNHNWSSKAKNSSIYCGELSLPLEIDIINNRLTVKPAKEVYDKRVEKLFSSSDICSSFKKSLEDIGSLEIVLDIDNNTNQSFSITIEDKNGRGAKIELINGIISIVNLSGEEKNRYQSPIGSINRLQVFFDYGMLGVYANDGEIMGTRRFYHFNNISHLSISAPDVPFKKVTGYLY